MKSLLYHALLFLSILLPFMSRSQTTLTSDQQEVNRTILAIGKAWSQNNLDTLEKYIEADYRHTDVRGQILDRKSWLGYVADRKAKDVKNPDISFEDTQINIYDDFAFVTGVNTFSGNAFTSNESGSAKPKRLRYTQVLKKENGIWKRIIFQATYMD
jgi:hypothetical protein